MDGTVDPLGSGLLRGWVAISLFLFSLVLKIADRILENLKLEVQYRPLEDDPLQAGRWWPWMQTWRDDRHLFPPSLSEHHRPPPKEWIL